jgi:hypothetical protein
MAQTGTGKKKNLRLHPMLWGPISKSRSGDTFRSLPRTFGRRKSGQINVSDLIINMTKLYVIKKTSIKRRTTLNHGL